MAESGKLTRGSAEAVGMDAARIEMIRARARGWVADGDMPSLVLFVARKGVVVLEEAYGILRPSDNAPLRTDSIFPVMSLSKSFTAAAILCLVEDGVLSLKHPITDLLPEITAPGTDHVLIADLLTHTSGYDDFTVFPHTVRRFAERAAVPEAAPGQDPDLNRLIHHAADAPLDRAPGEAMCYCNFGYMLLGDIIRRASGRPFAEFVESRIFQPLGMKNSYFVLPGDVRQRQRVLRDASCPDLPSLFPAIAFPPAQFPPADSEVLDALISGSGGAKSAAGDIAAFAQMLLNGGTYAGRRVLSRASVAAMTAPQLAAGVRMIFSMPDPTSGAPTEVPVRGGSYGYGLFLHTLDDRTAHMNGSLASARSFGHSGLLGSMFWADPETGVVGVYLSVMPRLLPNGEPLFWRFDHFQDMVYGAIID